jgi:molybdopterin-guanine dinucleotide biosynthesis protein MobB
VLALPNADWPVVIGIVGRSGSGKTSLLEHMIAALESRGIAVGAAKHASHGFLADRPGKDSHRLYESGARAVALISIGQTATFTRCAHPPSIEAALAALPPGLDLVLAEGFSWEPIPRVLVRGPGHAPKPDDLSGGEVLDIVEVRSYPKGAPPVFDPAKLASLEAKLAAHVNEAWAAFSADPSRRTAARDREAS